MREGAGYYNELEQLKIYAKELVEYYQDKGFAIIGLNDSQGVNITSTFYKKGLLDYIADLLKVENILEPTVINAFSLLMNKTEHIDYFLQNNLNLEEIKLSQVESAISAFEKVMIDINMPKAIGKIGNLYKLVYKIKEEDKNIYITDTIRDTKEPTIIYSSGVNNLMREVGNNPFSIKGDYKNREKRPNYYYTLNKTKNPATLDIVLRGIEKNFKNILTINNNADIYTLGAYIPASLEIEGMNIFRDLVLRYNELLEKLCEDYKITYINTELIGKKYNNSQNNFHISSKGHNVLANYILKIMYERKIVDGTKCKSVDNAFTILNKGAHGVSDATYSDYKLNINKTKELEEYEKVRTLSIADEHKRESEVFSNIKSQRKADISYTKYANSKVTKQIRELEQLKASLISKNEEKNTYKKTLK